MFGVYEVNAFSALLITTIIHDLFHKPATVTCDDWYTD